MFVHMEPLDSAPYQLVADARDGAHGWLCFLCCCLVPCVPGVTRGHQPQALRELDELLRMQTQGTLTPRVRENFNVLQKARVKNQHPRADFWEDVYPLLKTGDLVLSRGVGSVSSACITAFTGRFSHVGMVYRSAPDAPVLLWESVSHLDGCLDECTRSFKVGVWLVDLDLRARNANSPYFALVRLICRKGDRERFNKLFREFSAHEHHKPYEKNLGDLCRLGLDCGTAGSGVYRTEDSHSYFCSELVCETYKALGLLSAGFNSSRWCPSDFVSYDLPLQGGCRVREIVFTYPPVTGTEAAPVRDLFKQH
jgi:hypothetical protein